jgi:beta-galactosidase
MPGPAICVARGKASLIISRSRLFIRQSFGSLLPRAISTLTSRRLFRSGLTGQRNCPGAIMQRRHLTIIVMGVLLLLGYVRANPPAETANLVMIDASRPAPPPQTGKLHLGGKSPSGRELGVNSQYLTLDGAPWLPVMGEFHFSRYPEQDWEDELLKMQAGGIEIVSTYVFWIHQEEVEGQFDWSGRRNLRRFIELCRAHALYAFVRIGPWAHGECRNGGFPDWLIKKCPKLRSNDPCYLNCVRRYFGEIGKQLQGLFWKEGGPIIGVQLENEYLERGAEAGAAHIAELKRLALGSGIDAPLFTVTGWGDPEFPAGEVIPVFGGYPDAFWDTSLCMLPPSVNYFFNLTRDDGAVGANLRPLRPAMPHLEDYPFLTAELGGGMETSYHRRPAISADDVGALALAKLGSGANLLGYYMYHGGMNPAGKLSTLQESQATGYPNDLPVISYDFQAPLGEFGQVRPSYGVLKTLHLFLRDFGSELATMTPFEPAAAPVSIYDTQTPRVIARVKGDNGFVFINNYQRNYPLPARQDFQVALKLASETVTVPRKPTVVPAGAYLIWPVNLNMDGVLLKYSTAQLLSKVSTADADEYFFFAWPGIEPEFAVDTQSAAQVEAHTGEQSREEGIIYVRGVAPGTNVALEMRSASGRAVNIVVLPRQQAEECYKFSLAGRERVLLSPADVFLGAQALHLRSRTASQLDFSVFPALEPAPEASAPLRPARPDGVFEKYSAALTPGVIPVQWTEVHGPRSLGPVKMGPRVALAPTAADFERAGEWRIAVPENALKNLSNLFLRIQYVGDVGRLLSGGRLLDDNFYNGSAWEIGLKPFGDVALGRELILEIYPLRKGAPVYLPKDAWPPFPLSGGVAQMRSVSLAPEYELVVRTSPMPPREKEKPARSQPSP